MSSSAAPITATADHVCIADEGSVTVLASSSLRQTSAIPASSVMALHIDPSNNKQNPSLVTTLDVDGSFATHILGVSSSNNRKTAASTTSGKNPNQSSREVFPASSKLTSLSPSPSIATVVAASMHRPAGFSFNIAGGASNNAAAGGKKPLTASALLSCGTVVHHSDVSASTTRKPKILGRHPRMAQLSNLIFAASPTLPLVVVAQPGKKTIFVFYVDPSTLDDDTVSTTQSVQQDQDDAATSQQPQQKNTNNKKKNSNNNKKKQNQESESDNSDNDDDDDDESIDLDIDASSLPTLGGRATNLDPATASALLPLTIQSPVAISTLTLHPTRPSLAIGSTRGEVCIMHDIFNHTNKNVATGGPHQHTNNNKHSSGRHQQMWIDHWHHTPVSALTFGGGQEGTLLLSGASEGVICLWNIGSNYARTNISLGAGVNEVNRVTAIRIAHDEPSKCFVAIGDGEIQLSALDLAHRRLVAKRDGLTIAYSSFSSSYLRKRNLAEGNQETANELLLAPVNNPFAENDSTVVTSPVAWLDGGAVTAVFLYKRNSGKVRLYDPFERRSLRSSVLTTSVETIQNPPTVGLQFVASTPDGKRVACFESSKQKIMPPALKFLVYDEGMNRFRQVQQANDPHPGESSLVGAFWVLNRRGNYVLVTVSKQRVKVWSPLNDTTVADNADDAQLVSSLLNPAAIATSFKNKKVVADDDQNYLMSCSNDVVLRYHPTLSLLGGSSTHINTATVSADQSLLYLASDVVAAIDLQSLIDQTTSTATTSKTENKDEENKASPIVHAHIASSSSVSATDKKKNYAISASASSQTAGSIVVAYPHSIAIFGIVVPSSSSSSSSTPFFGCRSVLFDEEKFSVLSVSSPFVGSSSSKQQQEQQEESDFVVALVASSSTEQQQQQVSAKLYLIDINSCKIVAAAPWQAKYAPGCRRSLTLLSSVSSSSSSAWRCTVGVATSTRGFRTLNVVLREEYLDENEEENKKNKKQSTAASSKQQQASSSNEDDANALVSLAPVQTVDEEHAVRNREQVSSFFKKIDHFQATSTSTTNSMAIQRQLMMSTAEKVEKGKYAAMYGKEVLGATTFFATPSMSSVTASVFARLEDGGDVEE